jgi:hypothetical protein
LSSSLPVTADGTSYVAGIAATGYPGTFTASGSCDGALIGTQLITLTGSDYVALGDSFASGEGAATFLPGSDQPDDMCHRATDGYAETIAQARPGLDFAACSGALVRDVFRANHSNTSEIAQIFHLSDTATHLVTFSIGGNDIGFADVIADCLSATKLLAVAHKHTGGHGCEGRNTKRMTSALGWLRKGRNAGCYQMPGINADTGKPRTVCGQQDSLEKVYEQMAAHTAPDARMLITGYPAFFGTKFKALSAGFRHVCVVGSKFGSQADVVLSDAKWLNDVADQLNATIRGAVTRAARATHRDIEMIDVDTAFRGHRLCDTYKPYFNGLIINGKSLDQRSMHPNQQGQAAYYKALAPRT